MSEAAKILGEAISEAIRKIVREEIAALNSAQAAPAGSGRLKARARGNGLLTPGEAAEELGLSRSSILRMIAADQLPAVCLRAGKRKKVWRVDEKKLGRWIQTKANGSQRRHKTEEPKNGPSQNHATEI